MRDLGEKIKAQRGALDQFNNAGIAFSRPHAVVSSLMATIQNARGWRVTQRRQLTLYTRCTLKVNVSNRT